MEPTFPTPFTIKPACGGVGWWSSQPAGPQDLRGHQIQRRVATEIRPDRLQTMDERRIQWIVYDLSASKAMDLQGDNRESYNGYLFSPVMMSS